MKKSFNNFTDTVLKSVGMAMGIAVVVLTILNELDTNSGILMLGIGVACLGITLFTDKKSS